MKICPYCQQELEEDVALCPHCGKAPEDEAPVITEEPEIEAAEEAEVEEAAAETTEEDLEAAETAVMEDAPKKSSLGWILGAAAVVLLILAVLFLKGGKTAGEAYHINAYGYPSYSVYYDTHENGKTTYSYMVEDGSTVTLSEDTVAKLQNEVVATCGSDELTNRELIFFYQQSLYDFYNAYGNYVSFMMDTGLALDEQLSLSADGTTWQQDMLTGAFATYNRLYAMYQKALDAGYELDAQLQADLDRVPADMDEMAAQQGMESGDAYLASVFGPGTGVADYVEFLRVNYIAGSYASSLVEQIEVTAEDLETFYQENTDYFDSYGIAKTDKNNVHVRHILISVEDTENEDSWTQAQKQAQDLLALWKQGEATEDSFAALANEHSTDPGSNTNGGLYEDVYPGQMVEPFNDWCFAEGRMVGDTGVVKTDYGYHVMFFSGVGDSIYWQDFAREAYLSDQMSGLYAEAAENCKTASYPEKVMILEGNFAPSVPAEAETDAAPVEDTETAAQ